MRKQLALTQQCATALAALKYFITAVWERTIYYGSSSFFKDVEGSRSTSVCVGLTTAILLSLSAQVPAFGQFSPQDKMPAAETALEGYSQFVEQQLKDWDVPGSAVAIIKDGEVVFVQGFGYRDVAQGLKVTPNTMFNIASTAKAITAVSLGLLVDEGKLEWDTPVRKYLPGFRLADPFASERITARDLLTHRSGLPGHDLAWVTVTETPTRKEMMQRLQFLEPSKDFRTNWQYSNLMYLAASEVVEKVSGMSWDEWVHQRIFDPLEMTNSNISETYTRSMSDYSLPYWHLEEVWPLSDDIPVYGRIVPVYFQNYENCGGCDSIQSNAIDMAKWVDMNLQGGKHGNEQIISSATLSEIHSPQMVVNTPARFVELPSENYGFGWFLSAFQGHKLLWHTGGALGMNSMVSMLPEQNIGIVVLTNIQGTPFRRAVTYNAYERLLGLQPSDWTAQFKAEQAEYRVASETTHEDDGKQHTLAEIVKPSRSLEEYTGKFFNPGYGPLLIQVSEKRLEAEINGFVHPLEHHSYDTFKGGPVEVEGLAFASYFRISSFSFRRNIEGRIDSVVLKVPLAGELEVQFERSIVSK